MPAPRSGRGSSARQRSSFARRLFVGEMLEARWTPAWSGVPPTSISPPAAAVSVSLNSQNDATGAASIATTEVDYYSFVATTSGSYVLSATTPSSSLDTVLGLFSSTGARLAYNDDISSSNRDSRITVNLTAGTRYYIGITNYTRTSGGSYTWTIDGPAAVTTPTDDAYENNDSQSTANNLGTLTSSRTVSNLVMADASDWYQFTMNGAGSSASSVSISFQNSQGNLELEVYDSSGALVGRSNGTGNGESVSLNGRAAGTYSVRVYGANSATNPSYSLTINPGTATSGPVGSFPDVAYYGGSNDWNLNAINAPESWAQGYTGSGVVVAVIDTGVDLDHPDLVSQLWVNADEIAGNGVDDDRNGYVDDVNGWDFVNGDRLADDGNGHGTHVAGTIAAARNGTGATGVAPDADIMAIRVLDNNGSGSDSAVAAGIRYAAANGADIINLSLGGGYSSTILSAIQYAAQLNVLVVAASGNESASVPGYPARHSATMTNVLSVGAHNSSNTIASFSNDVGTSGAVQVDAPGVSIYSTYVGARYASMSGTSMATPHVAGLAALALSARPTLSASELRTLIVNGATRTISGSDSRGGVNAAITVALAAAGQTSQSAVSGSTTRTYSTTTSNLLSRYFAASAVDVSDLRASSAAATEMALSTRGTSLNAFSSETRTPESHRDQAIMALVAESDLEAVHHPIAELNEDGDEVEASLAEHFDVEIDDAADVAVLSLV